MIMTILYLNVLTKSRASSRGKTWKTSVCDKKRSYAIRCDSGNPALGSLYLYMHLINQCQPNENAIQVVAWTEH